MRTPSLFARIWALLLLVFVVTGCDIQEAEDAFDQVEVIITLEEIDTIVVGAVVDASNGSFVRNDVELTFSGDNAGDLIDIYSDAFGSRSIDDGITTFGVDNNVVPSDGNPISFRVLANKDGYETGVANVVIDETGQHQFTILMTRTITNNSQAAAVGASRQTTNTQTGGNGATTATTSVSTPTTAQTTTSTTVTVPAGTQATTDSGQTLSGTVTTNVNYFPPTSNTANQAFPGGMTNVTVTGGSGGTRTGALTTAGFVNVAVTDANGNKASSISQPINVAMQIPQEILGSGKRGSADTFTIILFNASTGEWEVVEQSVTADANGVVTFDAANLGTFAAIADASTPTCTMTYAINRNGNSGIIAVTIAGNGILYNISYAPGVDSAQITGVPATDVAYTASATPSGLGTDLGVTNVSDGFCNAGTGTDQTITINLSTPPAGLVDFTLNGRADCGDVNVKPPVTGFTGFYKPQGSTDAQAVLIPEADVTQNATTNGLRLRDVDVQIRGVAPGTVLEFFAILDSDRQDFSEPVTVPPTTGAVVMSTFDVDDDLCSIN